MKRFLGKLMAVVSAGLIMGGIFFFIFSESPAEATKTYFTPHAGVIPAAWLNPLNNIVFDGNTGINGHYAKINLTSGANVTGNLPWTMLDLTYGNLRNLPYRNYTGLQGIPRSAGLIKAASNGTLSTAVSGTDYAPATSGTSILKGNGSGGTTSAVAGTDYQAAITASGILKGAGGGSVSAAVAGTDYDPATSGTSILKGNGSGGTTSAVAGTDFVSPSTTVAGHALSSNVTVNMADLAQTDVTTNNVSTTAHGFVPKAPNVATEYLDGTGNYSTPGAGSGSLLNVQYLTSGTTYTPTTGTQIIIIEMVGGGGGGGGVTGATSNAAAGGGGGSGGYLRKMITGFSGTATYAIGSGGSGGANTGGVGSSGGATTFTYNSVTYTANGGGGAPGEQYGTAAALVSGGAGAAVSTNGDVNGGGSQGGWAQRISGTLAVSGAGAGTVFGSGGNGLVGQANGSNGKGYGGGGSGAMSTGSAYTGGSGTQGIIIVWEFS